jgi:hypothetical protein
MAQPINDVQMVAMLAMKRWSEVGISLAQAIQDAQDLLLEAQRQHKRFSVELEKIKNPEPKS